jgi:hypothetical protein
MVNINELIKKYPIRVNQWKTLWLVGDCSFTSEISDFGPGKHINDIKDPWNRTFKNISVIVDDENELVRWDCYTTIEGEPVKCIVFND